MERTIVVIPGLFGGVSKKHYRPLAEMFGSEDFLLFRAGADWEPMDIAEQIREIDGYKVLVCLSCGAIIGNLLANDSDTEVYYICPYVGADFINREKKAYVYRMRHLFGAVASVLVVVTRPFKNHRWYPLYGGTKPDGWFLSIYAICKQLKYAFSDVPTVNRVDGLVLSYGDSVVEPTMAIRTSSNAVVAKTACGKYPAHVNLRDEGEKFGSTNISQNGRLSEDAKAYLSAFGNMLNQRSR